MRETVLSADVADCAENWSRFFERIFLMREKVKEVFDEALRFIADFSLCPLSPLCSLSFKERGGVRMGRRGMG
jgi:hypothetical protein